jgi:YVTN family beta-propeller protein
VAHHPLRERLRAQLILALYRCGRQADALAAYRSGRALLVEELGLEPGPRLQDLERAILRHDDELELDRTRATVVTATRAAPAAATGGPSAPVARPGRRRGFGLLLVLVAAGVAIGLVVVAGGSVETRAALRGNGVAIVSSGTGGPSASVALGASPSPLAAGASALWITHVDGGAVTRVDLATRAVRQTIRVGAGPSGIAVAAGDVWVANSLDGTISRIDAETDAVVQTIPVGSQPSAVTASDSAVWVGEPRRRHDRAAGLADRARERAGAHGRRAERARGRRRQHLGEQRGRRHRVARRRGARHAGADDPRRRRAVRDRGDTQGGVGRRSPRRDGLAHRPRA